MGQKVHPYGFRLGFNKTWRSRWYLGSRLREAAARGSRAAAGPEEAVLARRRVAHRDRARGEQVEDRHLHLAPGDHHRPQGHRGRQAEAGDPEADQPRGLHQHPGDPEARARGAADRRVGGGAAREARRVPSGDAQGRRVGAAVRRPRDQGARVGPAERRGDRAVRVVLHGQLPLQTLRADIDYGFAEASTTYGQIGVKVWLYKGERLVPRVGRDEEYRDRAPRRPTRP